MEVAEEVVAAVPEGYVKYLNLITKVQSIFSPKRSNVSFGASGSSNPTNKRRTHADNIPDSEKPFSCERKSCGLCSELGTSKSVLLEVNSDFNVFKCTYKSNSNRNMQILYFKIILGKLS